jgi:flagellar motor switch protein FliG
MVKPVKLATRDDVKSLTGPERAAVLLLALGEEHGGSIWKSLDDDEVKEESQVMSKLGTI